MSSSIATKRSTCKDLQSSKDVSSCIHDSASLERAASALDLNRSFPSDGLAGANSVCLTDFTEVDRC